MKLKQCRLANAVKIGDMEQTYVQDKGFYIELDGHIVRIEDKKTKAFAYTSLMNVIFWHPAEDYLRVKEAHPSDEILVKKRGRQAKVE